MSTNPTVEVVSPTNTGKFCITSGDTCDSAHADEQKTRGITPYGFLEEGSLLKESFNLQRLKDSDSEIDKVILDLVLIRDLSLSLPRQKLTT